MRSNVKTKRKIQQIFSESLDFRQVLRHKAQCAEPSSAAVWFLHTVAEGQNEIGFRFCTVKNVQESSKVGVVI